MALYETTENSGMFYPLTNCNFLVTVENVNATAAFTSVRGVSATVGEISFRQGNAHSLAPVKIPGLVTHSAITLSFGYTLDSAFKQWIIDCVSERRKKLRRSLVQIELIDTNEEAPQQKVTSVKGPRVWKLTNAWVSQYNGPDLDASNASVAIESVSITYEELIIPN